MQIARIVKTLKGIQYLEEKNYISDDFFTHSYHNLPTGE